MTPAQVATNAAAVRNLAAGPPPRWALDGADALLPVVDKIARRRAAQELRELAGSLESRARLFRADAAPLEDAALKARARADALEAE